MQEKIGGIEKINKSMWVAYKEYLSTKDKKAYQESASRLELEYDTELMICFCRNLYSAWEGVIRLMEMCFEKDADVSDMHSCVSDIQNSAWAIYKRFMKDHSVMECTGRYAELVRRYKDDKDMMLFAQTLILSWVPVINSLKADFNSEAG